MNEFRYAPPKNTPVSSENLLQDLKLVAKKLGREKLPQSLYSEHGKYNPTTISRRFNTWNSALFKAGLKVSNTVHYEDETLFKNILNVWQKKGSQPTQRDMKTNRSAISQNPYYRRFGSWTKTIQEFIKYANGNDIAPDVSSVTQTARNKTSRDPSLRLRYKVLKREIFLVFNAEPVPQGTRV